MVVAGTDKVISVMPLPPGGELRNVWGEVHLIGTTNKDRDLATVYSLGGYIIPTLASSGPIATDTVFDEMVPKDVDVDVTAGTQDADLEREAADAAPFDMSPE